MSKSILLTGGTGYLGSNLLKSLLSNDYQITILKRSTSSLERVAEYASQVRLVAIDIENIELIFEENTFDGIIHTAASYGRKGEGIDTILEANLIFPLKLLNLAIKNRVGFFINTDTSLPATLNAYSLSKAQFKGWLNLLSSQIKVINVVPEYFYGPNDDDNKFITSVVRKLLRHEQFIDFTEGTQERDFIYIDDVVSAYICILNNIHAFHAYIDIPVGSSTTISLRRLVEDIKKLTGNSTTELNFGSIPMRKGEIFKSQADIAILRSLGWNPSLDLQEGIKEIIKLEQGSNLSYE